MKKFIVLVCCLFFGCTFEISTEENTVPQEVAKEAAVYFCPRDNCTAALVDLIGAAEMTVHCALFDLQLPDVIAALGEKSKSIDVRVVVDDEHYGDIVGPGVRKDTSSQFSHNKFCVIDGSVVSTGSFNPTERGATKNNNNMIVVHSRFLAQNYEDEFAELWGGTFGDGETVQHPVVFVNGNEYENYFCPEDDCKGEIISELQNANESIYFMVFSFTDEDVADALLFNEDIEIKGVFEKFQAGSRFSQYNRLKDFGVDVRLDNNTAFLHHINNGTNIIYNAFEKKGFLHHKVFIIDNKTVITGSANPTGAGFNRNDENILIIHDERIAERFLEEFEGIWWRNS